MKLKKLIRISTTYSANFRRRPNYRRYRQTVNFKNSIIIMTSNIGIEEFNRQAGLGFAGNANEEQRQGQAFSELSQRIEKELKNHFRPEFLNRIDEVIIFKPLSRQSLLRIAKLQISDLLKRLLAQKLKAQISTRTFDFLVDKGYAPDQGARGLRRVIQNDLEAPLANKLLSEEIKEEITLKIGINKDKITIN
jgi:ATP-dependent Clp protease ATP-binding subunit ClpA